MQQKLLNRFLNYVQVNTMSDEASTTYPSSPVQIDFAKRLVDECKAIGLEEVSLDDYGYVMATLPANTKAPTIGFIAHMDTVPDYPGNNVHPKVIENYQGDALLLNAEGTTLNPNQFPILKELKGETLITTDGTTVLGADDKAGIAEILTAMEYLIAHPEIPHGKIRIGFTPDEEIGHGVDYFDVSKFGADFAYTIDGCALGELQYENFNAASATITFHGVSVHPGSSKNKMRNSILLANQYQSKLPPLEVPEHTEDYEGFYHLHDMKGTVEKTTLHYIIRDHDTALFEKRKQVMLDLVNQMNQEAHEIIAEIVIKDQYHNMKEIIVQSPYIIDLAKNAFKTCNVTPLLKPIRGGTDGARLSFMNLPCPNIFTGGYNCHGKYEFAVLSHMLKATEIIVEIAKQATQL